MERVPLELNSRSGIKDVIILIVGKFCFHKTLLHKRYRLVRMESLVIVEQPYNQP